jgi:transcriptional regulator with GAF, ATPase, and Fis domain
MTKQPTPTAVEGVQSGSREEASREKTLSELFVALADTLVADFDVVELLDRLVSTCIELFDVSAAGVLIFDKKGQLRLMASSNDRAEHLEVFQLQADEGPCLDCARGRTPISVSDLNTAKDRWPRFFEAARVVGFRAVHAVPLRLRSEGLGGFGLFHNSPTELSNRDLHAVQALADVATIGLLQQQHAHQAEIVTDQLQHALDSRVAVEQAKGILAESRNVTVDVAFEWLRRYARNHNLKLTQIARAISTREIRPDEIFRTAND